VIAGQQRLHQKPAAAKQNWTRVELVLPDTVARE